MRYRPDHKIKARAYILEAASRRLKEEGFDGVGVNALMEEAGLTTGAFYSHFSSKDELCLEVLRDGLIEVIRRLDRRVDSNEPVWVSAVLKRYFDKSRCLNVGDGCILPALTVDASRSGEASKEIFEQHVLQIVDRIRQGLKEPDGSEARGKAWTVLSLMVGTVTIARALPSGDAQDEILASVFEISERIW